MDLSRIKAKLKAAYYGTSTAAIRFQGVLIILDLLIIGFFIVAPFLERDIWYIVAEYSIAFLLAVDLSIRAWCHGDFWKWLRRPIVWVDLIVLITLLIPPIAAAFGFLRILRLYTLVNSAGFWRVVDKGRWQYSQYADTIKALFNLVTFIFVMTALVHSMFAGREPKLTSYIESLYFTVTTLSTTGFGDITLPGTWGRIISMIIMIGGVSLFFRLIQTLMRAPKVRFPCPACGLQRHDTDAVHCKACGETLNIPDDND